MSLKTLGEVSALTEALEQCITNQGAMGYLQPKKYAHVRFDEINRVARAALAKAREEEKDAK